MHSLPILFNYRGWMKAAAQFQQEPVALQELMADVVQRLQPLAGKVQIILRQTVQPVTVLGVRQVLQELIYNLCENAIKYNKPQGTVQIRLTAEAGQAVLAVADTGIGIPAEEQAACSSAFIGWIKAHSRTIGGTGLGLSIVKHGVQLHGGEIQLESQVGQGTAITVRLPLNIKQQG